MAALFVGKIGFETDMMLDNKFNYALALWRNG